MEDNWKLVEAGLRLLESSENAAEKVLRQDDDPLMHTQG